MSWNQKSLDMKVFVICEVLKSTKFRSEAATKSVLYERVFLEISQNSQGNTCAIVSLLIKLQAWVRLFQYILMKSTEAAVRDHILQLPFSGFLYR